MLKHILIIIITALMLNSCGKELVQDEPVIETPEQVVEQIDEQNENTQQVDISPVASDVQETTVEVPEIILELVENPETIDVDSTNIEIFSAEMTDMDSIEVFYMIRPNDYLVKIAINEYGRPTMWRKIWNWNYDSIGDNPNIIYPYRELSLKKPIEYAVKTEFTYYDYVVKPDDTLWSIAKQEYDNNLAWIVILRDNYDEISDDYNNLEENTVLKLRSKLY